MLSVIGVYLASNVSIIVEYILAVKILHINKDILKKDVFILNEIECNFIKIVPKMSEEFCTDNNLLKHDSSRTDFREEDKIGFALSSSDFFLKELNFIIKQEVILLKIDKLFSLFCIFEIGKLILEPLEVVSYVVVLDIAI